VEHATDYTIEAGRVAMAALLTRQPVTAVLAANDLLAVGCYEALAAQGLRCPDDVSVVGFNNMELTAHLNPSLSTVSMPQYEMGRTAAKLVLDRLAEPDGASQIVALPTVFVSRASTCRVRA
jgi:LacI family transcriptional regulator